MSSLQVQFDQCKQGSRESVRDFELRLEKILIDLIDATVKRSKNPAASDYCNELLHNQALHVF